MSPSAPARIDAFGVSHIGKVRKENQDHFVVASLQKQLTLRQSNLDNAESLGGNSGPEALLFLVADGVGGQPGGALASGTAATVIVEYLTRAAGCFNNTNTETEHEFLTQLEDGVHQAHAKVENAAEGKRRPATTLTMALLLWPRAYLVHVGDSRALYLSKGSLRPLTRDQTVVEFLLDVGALTEDDAKRSSLGGTLYSALGGTDMTPSVGLVDFAAGDVLLLCSDGLTKHVHEAQVAAVLGTNASAEAMCGELLEAALAGGGTDNITVIVARMVA